LYFGFAFSILAENPERQRGNTKAAKLHLRPDTSTSLGKVGGNGERSRTKGRSFVAANV
jgi:hypothetical protein